MATVHFAEPLVQAQTPVIRPITAHGAHSPERLDLGLAARTVRESDLGLRSIHTAPASRSHSPEEDLRRVKSASPGLLPDYLASQTQKSNQSVSPSHATTHDAGSSSKLSNSPFALGTSLSRTSLPPQAQGHDGGRSALNVYHQLNSSAARTNQAADSLGLDPYEPLVRHETTVGHTTPQRIGSLSQNDHNVFNPQMVGRSFQNDYDMVRGYIIANGRAEDMLRRIDNEISAEEQILDDLETKDLDDASRHERLMAQGIGPNASDSTCEVFVEHQARLRELKRKKESRSEVQGDECRNSLNIFRSARNAK